MNGTWPIIYDKGQTYQFIPEPTYKIQKQQKQKVKDILSIENFWNDNDERPNQHKNIHKLCNKGHPLPSLKESQLKLLRQKHDLNFLIEGKPLQNKYYVKKKEIQKSRTVRLTVKDPSRKVNHLSKVG